MENVTATMSHREDDTSLSSFYVILLVILSLALNLYGINWGLPNGDMDWAPDSEAPLGPLTYAKRLLYGEPWLNKYPPFHFIVLAIFYSPYVLYLFLTGGLTSPADVYPYGLTNPQVSLTIFTLIARLTSAFMGTGMVVVNYFTVKKFYDSKAALISSFLIASSYPIIHYSHNANIDIPQLFWLSLALYSFVSLLETPKTKYYILLGLFTAFAVSTKESVFGLIVGLVPALLWFHLVHHRPTEGTNHNYLSLLFDRKILSGLLVSLVAAVIIFNPVFNWEGILYHVGRHTSTSIKGNWVIGGAENALQGHLQLLGQYLTFIFQSNGLPAFLLLAGGFFYCLARYAKKSWILIIPMVTYWLFFLQNHGTHHIRYILPVYLLLTWQAGKLGADLHDSKYMPRVLSTTLLFFVLGHSLVRGFSVDVLYTRDPRYTAEKWMEKNIPQGALILGVAPDYSLPRFPEGRQVVRRRLWDWNGNQIADITDINADYAVVGMSLPRRVQPSKWKKWGKNHIKDPKVEKFLRDRGYEEIVSFKSEVPFFGTEIADLHAINPRVVIWKKDQTKANLNTSERHEDPFLAKIRDSKS